MSKTSSPNDTKQILRDLKKLLRKLSEQDNRDEYLEEFFRTQIKVLEKLIRS